MRSRTSSAQRADAAERPVSDALMKLRRSEITLEEYLDDQADRAVEQVKALVNDEDRKVIRQIVRDQLEVDPGLVALVRDLTGQEPRPKFG